jgi:hypothetical protein
MIQPKTTTSGQFIDPHYQMVFKEHANKLRSKWRKVVTGDEKKRIRDRLQETQAEPTYVKFFDKVAFTFGVLNMGVCQYFLLNRPDLFPAWYALVMPVILGSRYFYFKGGGMQYFLIDFCYFSIFCSMVNLLLLRNSALFFRICFVNSTGPLMLAIPVWRNSFVFHDYDKIVSVYIHSLPSMLYYTMRHNHSRLNYWWEGVSNTCRADNCSTLHFTDYLVALALYIFWQAGYLLKTEFIDKARLDSDPQLLTSLRWMAKDTKNPFARFLLKVFRKVGIFGRDEDYDSRTLKTKAVFVFAQLLYTCVAFIPTPLMYYSERFHFIYILLIITSSVFNGASFYIEVFAKRYGAHIAKIEEMDKIARAARTAMSDLKELNALKESASSRNSAMHSHTATPKRRLTSDGIAFEGVSFEEAGTPAGSDHFSTTAEEVEASVEKSAENLSRLTKLLQQTSDKAWLEMKELVQKADELRGVYDERLSEGNTTVEADHSPTNGEYVVCGAESAGGSPNSEDQVPTMMMPLGVKTDLAGDDSPEYLSDAEDSPVGRARNDSVLSIDR